MVSAAERQPDDIGIPGDVAKSGNINASVQVTARDNQGRTGTVSTSFTITNCPPLPTPAPRGLVVAWVQQLPANMAQDNFYCPGTVANATAIARVTSDAGIDMFWLQRELSGQRRAGGRRRSRQGSEG